MFTKIKPIKNVLRNIWWLGDLINLKGYFGTIAWEHRFPWKLGFYHESRSRGSTEFYGQNLIQIGQEVPELWRDIKTNRQTEYTLYFIFIKILSAETLW